MAEAIKKRVEEAQKAERDGGKVDDKKTDDKPAAKDDDKGKQPADKNDPVLPKKTTTKDVDDSDAAIKQEIEVKTKGMDGAAKQAFADLRYEQRDLRRQLKEMNPKAAEAETLRAELKAVKEQMEKTPAAGDDALKAKIAEYENELMAVKVEKSDAYKNAVTKPLKAVDTLAEKLAKKYDGVSKSSLIAALHDTSDKQTDLLIAAVDGMNEIEKSQFYAAAAKVAEINEKADVLRTQAAEALAKIEAKQSTDSETSKQAINKARAEAHDGNWKKLAEALPDILTPMEGDDAEIVAWNDAQKGAEKFAKETDYSALKPDVQSQIMQRAAVFPLMSGAIASLQGQNTDLQGKYDAALEKLSKFESKVPGAGAGRSGEDTSDPAAGKTDFVDRVAARLKAAGIG